MADNVTGIVLDIPADVLNNIKNADKAIKDLEQTSKKAAQNIKRDFDTTMVGGVEAFIRKVQEAQTKLGGIKMPAFNVSGGGLEKISNGAKQADASISGLVQAMSQLSSASINTQQQESLVQRLREQYELLRASLNEMSQRNYNIKVSLDKTVEDEVKNIQSQIAALRQSNLQLGAKGDVSAIRANIDAIKQLERELDNIKNTKITLLGEDKSKQELDALRQRVASVFAELQEAQRKLATDNALNAALERQKENITKYTAEIQKLDAYLSRLNAQGKMYNADGSYSTQAISLLQQRAALEKQINEATLSGRQAQLKYEKQLAEEKKRAQQESVRAAKEQAMAEKQAQREAAQDAKERAKAEADARRESARAAREQAKAEADAAKQILQAKKEAQRSLAQQKAKILASPQGAMDYAKNARNLRDLQAAYQNLKKVMATVDPKSAQWQQMNAVLGQTRTRIENIKKSMGELNQHASRGRGLMMQLKNAMMLAFSVSAIKGYIDKMIEARKQMELQQVALRAILQNKDEADRVFYQVQQLALQSPFSILQMTTYTKQLAAYRVEANKLVGTTKMLADVSAGLGVDMQRLILAYGQVKSANYLRATEVRQFTEAGLNIAGELAKYFSELQGKMISVGDVMEMITKRMVRFEDVEEVFKRVTSAGGIFYDMQKKQSETLYGQIQRIGDALTMMFNEIGKSNEGVIMWTVKAIRSLINSWRILTPYINAAGTAFLSWMIIGKGIPALLGTLKAVNLAYIAITNSTNRAAAAQKSLGASNPYALIITMLLTIITLVYQWASAQDALTEELNRVMAESNTDMWNLIETYRKEADIVKDTTKSYEERNKALENLQNTFKDILPSQMLEYDYITKTANGYKEATETIKLYSAEKARQKALETIQNDLETKWTDFIEDMKGVADDLKKAIPELANATEPAVKGVIGNVMLQIRKEVEEGTIKTGMEARNRFWEIINKRYPENGIMFASQLRERVDELFNVDNKSNFNRWMTGRVRDTWGVQNFSKLLEEGKDKMEEFEVQYNQMNAEMSSQDRKRLQIFEEEYGRRKEALQDLQEKLQAYYKVKSDGEMTDKDGNLTQKGIGVTQDLKESLDLVNSYRERMHLAKISWDEIIASTGSEMELMKQFDGIQQTILGNFLNGVEKVANNAAIERWATNTREALKSAGWSEMQTQIVDLITASAKAHGIEAKELDKIKVTAQTNYQSAANDAKALSDQARDNALAIAATTRELERMGSTATSGLLGPVGGSAKKLAEMMHGGQTKEEAEKEAKFWADVYKLLGGHENNKSKQSAKKANKDIWSPRLELMKKINTEYEKLLMYYSKEESMARIRTSYADSVAEAFKGTQWADISKWSGFDAKATIDRLKNLAEAAGKGYKKKFLEAAGTLQAELDIKIEEKNIQDAKDKIQKMFDNYELTKTLGQLGIDVNLTFMVGGQPMTLPEIKDEVQKKLNAVKSTQGEEKLVKVYEEYLRKIADMENNAAQERLKNYNKYLIQSVGERAQIELKAAQDINKITLAEDLDAFSKKQAIAERQKKMNDELAKFDFDQFKASDVYISVFKDLENASKEQLQYVIDKLKELQSTYKDLSPAQVKGIANDLKKAQDALSGMTSTKDLFSNLRDAISYAQKAKELKAEQVRLTDELNEASDNLSAAEVRLVELTKERDALQGKNTALWAVANLKVIEQQKLVEQLKKSVADIAKALGIATQNIENGENAILDWQKGLANAASKVGQMKEAVTSLFEGLDSMGLVSDSMRDNFESLSDVVGGVEKTLDALASIDLKKPFSVIKGGVAALGGIFQTIGGFFSIGDKKKERQIQKLQKRVEDLQKAYEKLGEEIERAYAYNDYKLGYEQSLKNLEAQKRATQQQINLEKDKKKTDKDKVKEWEDSLEEIADKERELRNQFYEDWGSYSLDKLGSAGEDFVSIWLDAFKETGDGIDALNDKWDEFFENLVLKQAASAVVNKRLKKYIERINAVLDMQGLSEKETSQRIKDIVESAKDESGAINDMLKDWFSSLGIGGGQGNLLLSDLQKGIQNITEAQAASIEAYLNSMRFAVFEQNTILTNMLTAIQEQYGTNADNPVLNELKGIRSLVASIDNQLSKVIVSRSSSASNYIVRVG